ncbi:MAG: oligosaccharide flippase family protein, partial [Boseongicola sp.]
MLALDVCLSISVAIVLARSLGAAGLGIYSVGVAVGLFMTPLLQAGIPLLLTREINNGNARGELPAIRGVMQFAFMISTGLSTIFGSVAYFAWPHIAAHMPSAYSHAILAGLFSAPAVALANIFRGGLQGWHKVGTAITTGTALRSGTMLILLAIALIFVPGWLTPGRAVWLNVAASATAFVIAATLLMTHTLRHLTRVRAAYSIAAWRGSMIRFTAVNGLMIAEQQALTFILATFASEAQVGFYRIAQRAAGLANLGLTNIARVIGPHIGKSHARGGKSRVQKLVTRGAQAMSASTFLVVLLFVGFGGEMLDLAVGPEFRSANLPLVVLSIGWFIRACFGPLEMLMNMTGHESTIIR